MRAGRALSSLLVAALLYQFWYTQNCSPSVEGDSRKRIHAKSYVEPGSSPPSEPVRDWLRSLPKDEMQEIGRDIRVAELSWPRVQDVRPRLVDYLGGDLCGRYASIFGTGLREFSSQTRRSVR